MMENSLCEHVEMTVVNAPGVLGRVAGHIRREGWNITKLFVDEIPGTDTSFMEIDIEGQHTKLAQVTDRMLSLDCVLKVAIRKDGDYSVKERALAMPSDETEEIAPVQDTAKPAGVYRILAINPGSTSTKFAVYDDEKPVLSQTVHHAPSMLSAIDVLSQKSLRKNAVMTALEVRGIDLSTLDAVSGRGGLIKPIDSGAYLINDRMLSDLSSAAASVHASALGGLIAREIADAAGIDAYVVDPIVVDEMDRYAKLSGIPGVERTSIFHALNHKAIARRLAQTLGKPYENCRLIVAHMGGGITVGAHRYGRVVDVNDALSGEGPFTPERSGSVPAADIIRMCFSGEYTEEEMIDKIMKNGGVKAYLGTSDLKAVIKMINDGDEFAALVLDSMAYQVCKEIGAMAAVLEGQVDAIVLTGGMAHSNRFTGAIKGRVDRLAPVYVFAGEDEMLALSQGVLRVLRGEESAAIY